MPAVGALPSQKPDHQYDDVKCSCKVVSALGFCALESVAVISTLASGALCYTSGGGAGPCAALAVSAAVTLFGCAGYACIALWPCDGICSNGYSRV